MFPSRSFRCTKSRWNYLIARSFCASVGQPVSERSLSSLRRVCIVGSGPSGFYTAKYLMKEHPTVCIDMVEELPTPFGLVRFGVAPDHPEVKSVQNDFENVAEDPRFSFFGNVKIGEDISPDELRKHYNAIVFAYGAATDRKLGIPGENLKGVLSAREFVNWYNGHPKYANLNPDLFGKTSETAVVIGNGNVALDCARILTKTANELKGTDITENALRELERSNIHRVIVAGRRGHVQAAFTIKELRELTKLEDAECRISPEELERGRDEESKKLLSQRPKKRIDDLLQSAAVSSNQPGTVSRKRSVELRFLLSPIEILPDPKDPSSYKSLEMPGVPFDHRRSIMPNINGKIFSSSASDSQQVPGLYCTGWLKRGPTGIIGTNIQDARETVAAILSDAESSSLPSVEASDPDEATSPIVNLLKGSSKKIIGWSEHLQIDAAERKRGESVGKPREKFTDCEEMISTAFS